MTLAKLLQRSLAGDPDAAQDLIQAHQAAVYRLALAILNDPAEAEEARQDTFITALGALDSYRGEASFKTWLLAITCETVSFDQQSGVEVRRRTQMQYADGAPVGETLNSIQVEYLDDLPGEVAQQFESYRAELNAYGCTSSALPCPATMPAPVARTAVVGQTFDQLQNLLDVGYAQYKPLQDGNLILQLLSALRHKHLAWMTKPGWYLYSPNLGNSQAEPHTRYILTHVTDDTGHCESLTYYQQGEQLLPQEILLADNRWGLIGTITDGSFTEGEANHAPCQLEGVESVTMLDNQINYLRDLLDGKTQGNYQAWTQQIDGRRVLVLHFDVQHQRPQPAVMDPDTHQLEIIARTLEWQYFDLEHGGWMGAKEQFYLANGKVLGSAPQPDDRLSAQYQALDRLPADLQQMFESTSTRLGEYLAKAVNGF